MRIAKYVEEWEAEEYVRTAVVVCYQPQYEAREWERLNFKDNYVYRRRRNAQMDFPNTRIVKFNRNYFSNPVYLD